MAWIATENFDSYSDGDLNGKNETGTGWSGAWSGNTAYKIQGVTTQAGAKAVKISVTAGNQAISRTLTTAVTVGTLIVYGRKSSTSANSCFVTLREGTNGKMYVQFSSDGNIKYYNGSTYLNLGTYSANTWYKLTFDWDAGTQANKWRLKLDDGTYTSFVGTNGTLNNIDNIIFDTDTNTGVDMYWDTIVPETVVTSSVKDANNLAYASIKNKDNLAVASIKNWNNLA